MLQSQPDTTTRDPFFAAELARLGPNQPPAAWDLVDAQAYCKMWALKQYENFSVVSFLLPRRIRQDFYNVYAYCRWADNLADEVADPDESEALLKWWEGQLSLCYSGRPAHPVLVALQKTVQDKQIGPEPFRALLSAFRQDQRVTRYEDEPSLIDYCSRSANPVGEILLRLAGKPTEEMLRLSDQVCTGLQLANFCQDMSRDAIMGRIYAPRELWGRHDVTESQILQRQRTDQLVSMLEEWVSTTAGYFERGRPLLGLVPRWLATDLDLFIRGGEAILDEIRKAKFDVWTRRPTVSKFRKMRLLVSSLVRRQSKAQVTSGTERVDSSEMSSES